MAIGWSIVGIYVDLINRCFGILEGDSCEPEGAVVEATQHSTLTEGNEAIYYSFRRQSICEE